ncbi:MAG: type II toxin-antitoxin system VapC family toxin [Candidatus Paceibacterota bacterium]
MSTKLKVFLDSNVVLKYLRGKDDVEFLFSSETLSKVTYSVNPIVIQEILLAQPEYPKRNLDEFKNHLEIKELNKEVSDKILSRVRQIRNKIVHTNDLLILGSAADCDYILTSDRDLLDLSTVHKVEGVNAITPQEFEENILPEL